ncbi:MAG: methylthioribulose 1-phosphate dehydratase [Elusimicrobia bacterium]|nr:methylthioribulose 1-phosphate dehydratase [Elusimicrobiota bacterium]
MTAAATSTVRTLTLADSDARRLVCDLCRGFYEKGWATGTGGGISIRSGERVYMAPSGVQKERLRPDDIFVVDLHGNILDRPDSDLHISACRPLFLAAYRIRNAGAVLHSHSLNSVMATVLFRDAFQITGIEMQKGITGHSVGEILEVPIIENTEFEGDLANALSDAIIGAPRTQAVLVRGHGVYVWGRDWAHAKAQAECYDYLFEAAVRLKQAGLDPSTTCGRGL